MRAGVGEKEGDKDNFNKDNCFGLSRWKVVGDISLRWKTLQVEPRVEERLGVPLGAFQSKFLLVI